MVPVVLQVTAAGHFVSAELCCTMPPRRSCWTCVGGILSKCLWPGTLTPSLFVCRFACLGALRVCGTYLPRVCPLWPRCPWQSVCPWTSAPTKPRGRPMLRDPIFLARDVGHIESVQLHKGMWALEAQQKAPGQNTQAGKCAIVGTTRPQRYLSLMIPTTTGDRGPQAVIANRQSVVQLCWTLREWETTKTLVSSRAPQSTQDLDGSAGAVVSLTGAFACSHPSYRLATALSLMCCARRACPMGERPALCSAPLSPEKTQRRRARTPTQRFPISCGPERATFLEMTDCACSFFTAVGHGLHKPKPARTPIAPQKRHRVCMNGDRAHQLTKPRF